MGTKNTLPTLVVLCICASAVYCWSPEALKDQVESLEGYLNFTGKFEMFSGYLELSPQIKTHYIFVTSTNKPSTDPVVLWLNGGPGCSSLLGFSQEIGPNMMYSGSKRFAADFNPYSWNQKANLLFLESPPGVGFSLNHEEGYSYNESRTAKDNVASIQAWFHRFPELLANDFWIAGESYCGMYIPNFASALLDAIGEDQSIKFKGIIIGNGVMVTEKHWRRQARNTFYSKHYFYGPEIKKLISSCSYNASDDTNPSCIRGNQMADQSVQMVNPYATIGLCYSPEKVNPNRRRFWYTPFFEQNNPMLTANYSGGPCTDDVGITDYFNQDIVKQQLHVDTSIQWETCNEKIGETYHKDVTSIDIFEKLKSSNLKIVLYSGNTDAVVSYVETEEYIKKIGWRQTSDKTAFLNSKSSLLGWKVEYDGLTLVIINGAGHMVPSDKPHAAYEMFSMIIQ